MTRREEIKYMAIGAFAFIAMVSIGVIILVVIFP
jgi:hypothetical protein